MRRPHIDLMGNRKWLFLASGLLTVISIAAILLRGLSFGIEFQGGTVLTFTNAGKVTESQLREELEKADVEDAVVQAAQAEGGTGDANGFIVRTNITSTAKAQQVFQRVNKEFGLDPKAGNVETISPDWGSSVTNAALIALAVSLLAILLYVSVRFEYKMSIVAIIALFHDILLALGIYVLFGREITPNTIAALLTILGFSLYDTIVVFHRIRENMQGLTKQSFAAMTNDSVNQVLVRSINTSLTQLIPVISLLLFGGETLKDFAFALLIGLAAGTYSSIALASPLYATWKEREPRYRALAKRFGS